MDLSVPPEPKKTWQERRAERTFYISASQVEAFDLAVDGCHRRWWLKNVRRLPEPQTSSQAFGTVLHSVAERFLRADDNGLSNGRPVELYPPGWKISEERDGKKNAPISDAEADQIQRLVAEAIESGVLTRRLGRRVEKQFNTLLAEIPCTCGGKAKECPSCQGDGIAARVRILGFIDLSSLEPEAAVEDHKTAKNRKYLKSADGLAKNHQMLIYAKAILEELRALGKPDPAFITLRHNAYIKETGKEGVRKTETRVTVAAVEAHWAKIQSFASLMAGYRASASQWFDVPDPPDKEKACRKYGGCPFLNICSGMESPEFYEKRMSAPVAVPLTLSSLPLPPKEIVMAKDLASLLAQKGIDSAPPAATLAPAPFMPEPVQMPTPPAPKKAELSAASKAAGHVLPPWASAAHGGLGLNADGTPDQVAVGLAPSQQLPGPQFFDMQVKDGCLHWATKAPYAGNADFVKAMTAAGIPLQGVSPLSLDWKPPVVVAEVREAVQAPAPAPVAAPVQAPAPTPAPAPVSAGQPLGEPFAIYFGCIPLNRPVVPFTAFFNECAGELAKAQGKPYFQIGAFDRRDMLAAAAPALAKRVPTGAHLVVDADGPDQRHFAEALASHASIVIRSFGK